MANFYDRPSPGESLLTEPKSRPYERPAKHSRLEEVIQFYMEKITNDEFIDNICRMLELETPVELIVESITLFFVMNGDHSMDNRILISPVLHEYIRMLGKQAGINVVDGLNDDEDTELTTNKFKAEKLREEIDRLRDTEEDDGGVDLMEQTAELLEGQEEETDDIMEADMPMEESPMTDELPEQMPSTEMMPNMDQGQGIMARRE
jgi:hypothetical protein